MNAPKSELPIAIFDSGVGGLTVASAIMARLPQENIVYFGDTARFPFGPRPLEQLRQFAAEIMDLLVDIGTKQLVMACNSMTAATHDGPRDYHGVPIIGVITPAAREAVSMTRSGVIGVIGTEATIGSGQYDRAISNIDADVKVASQACPEFVHLVETGETESARAREIANEYLRPLLQADIDTLILGCTHYPMLSSLIQEVVGARVKLVSSDSTVASELAANIARRRYTTTPERRFIVSGDPSKFRTAARRFVPEVDLVEELSKVAS